MKIFLVLALISVSNILIAACGSGPDCTAPQTCQPNPPTFGGCTSRSASQRLPNFDQLPSGNLAVTALPAVNDANCGGFAGAPAVSLSTTQLPHTFVAAGKSLRIDSIRFGGRNFPAHTWRVSRWIPQPPSCR